MKEEVRCGVVGAGKDTGGMEKIEPGTAKILTDGATQANFDELFRTYNPGTVRRAV